MALIISKAKRQIRDLDFKAQLHVYEDEALNRMVDASKLESGDETNDRDFVVEDVLRKAIAEFLDQEEKEATRKEKAAREATEAEARKAVTSMPAGSPKVRGSQQAA